MKSFIITLAITGIVAVPSTTVAAAADFDEISLRVALVALIEKLTSRISIGNEVTTGTPQVMGVNETDESAISTTSTDRPAIRVNVAGAEMLHTSVPTLSEAKRICEEYAYNTDYMWKHITCDYAGKIIYSDVFVAG